ncbi:hypothetical protein [Enterovibrio norvegicus]|uniref:hypothetical protein n=1 Tax=Enterovibrio norvegicus TaxID=188144 RepID=UPI000364CC05|nr:hypothetical protein [Enterovibrio norvegicus]
MMSTDEIKVDQEGKAPHFLYTVNMTSEEMFCGGLINGMDQLDNLSTENGTFMAGFNATAFLQKGDNTLGTIVVSADIHEGKSEHRLNGQCNVTVNAAMESGESIELTSLLISVNDDAPTAEKSTHYPSKNSTPLINLDGNKEGYTTLFTRNVYVKTIPEWAWTNAASFKGNGDDLKKLYRAYSELYGMMEKRDYKGLKAAWSLSNREKALAEAYLSTPEDFFNAIGIESGFEKSGDTVLIPMRNWEEYTLKTYADGKLFRLEDVNEQSPLRIGSPSEDWTRTFTPYFSMIDGRVVISR